MCLKTCLARFKNHTNHLVKKNKTFFLNGIRDRDYKGIKDQRDKLSLSDNILKLINKAINLGKAAPARSNTRSNRKINNR